VELEARIVRLKRRVEEGTINKTKAENRIALIKRHIRTYRRKIAEYQARIRRIKN
jgi:prefoldin subunit 5